MLCKGFEGVNLLCKSFEGINLLCKSFEEVSLLIIQILPDFPKINSHIILLRQALFLKLFSKYFTQQLIKSFHKYFILKYPLIQYTVCVCVCACGVCVCVCVCVCVYGAEWEKGGKRGEERKEKGKKSSTK